MMNHGSAVAAKFGLLSGCFEKLAGDIERSGDAMKLHKLLSWSGLIGCRFSYALNTVKLETKEISDGN